MIRNHHRFMMGFTRKLFLSFKRPAFLYLVTLSVSSITLFSFAFHAAEFGNNPSIHEYFDSFYYAVTVTTGVGLGDIVAVTKTGRILSILMMFLSTGLYVSFTGVIAGSLLGIELENFQDNTSQEDSL